MNSLLLNKISISIIVIGSIIFLITASYLSYGLYSANRLEKLNASQEINIIDGYSSDIYVNLLHPKDWAFPIWGEKDHISNTFNPNEKLGNLSETSNLISLDLVGPAIQIVIPSISVDSEVQQLNITVENGMSKYETPKNLVGGVSTNIETMNSVSGWYFGHFDSPIQREGNVFQNLPEVATHIKNGDPVFIYIKSLENEYIYQAISSKVMHESEVELYDAGIDHVILVTCANKPLYNYRQLVKAKLIAIN